MSTLSVRLPTSIHRQLRELAQKEGVAINQLITTAVAEKMAALLTVDYLQERASRGSRSRFDAVLRKVASRAPAQEDQLD